MNILILVLWCLFAYLEGIREAKYWHVLFHTDIKPSLEHVMWTMLRAVVFGAYCFWYFAVNYLEKYNIWVTIVFLFSFPFWHDGAYYQWRHYFAKEENHPEIYPKGFFDFSHTSTALLTFLNTPVLRTIYFIISIIIYIFII